MIWQDIVISVGQWIFVLALIPTIRGKEKPALFTSVLTSSFLLVFAFTFATLSLWNSAISTAAVAVAWSILAVQGYKKMKNVK